MGVGIPALVLDFYRDTGPLVLSEVEAFIYFLISKSEEVIFLCMENHADEFLSSDNG